jgi:hypothetical protein
MVVTVQRGLGSVGNRNRIVLCWRSMMIELIKECSA